MKVLRSSAFMRLIKFTEKWPSSNQFSEGMMILIVGLLYYISVSIHGHSSYSQWRFRNFNSSMMVRLQKQYFSSWRHKWKRGKALFTTAMKVWQFFFVASSDSFVYNVAYCNLWSISILILTKSSKDTNLIQFARFWNLYLYISLYVSMSIIL